MYTGEEIIQMFPLTVEYLNSQASQLFYVPGKEMFMIVTTERKTIYKIMDEMHEQENELSGKKSRLKQVEYTYSNTIAL
jgi:hypothetical protein